MTPGWLAVAVATGAACGPAGPPLGDFPGAHTPGAGASGPRSATSAPATTATADAAAAPSTSASATPAATKVSCPPTPPAPSGPCPAGMVRLPPRSIAEWKATHQEKKLFKLDCKREPARCHQPAHAVPAFCIDRAEVTALEYRCCVQAGQCTDTHLDCGSHATYGSATKRQHPVNCVDHQQAEAYCRAQGKELPTREQFGWAQSSGGYDSLGHLAPPWGGRYPNEDELWASIGAEPRTGTAPAGGMPKGHSKQGATGLFGNVREWLRRYQAHDGSSRVAVIGFSFETTRSTPIGAGRHEPVQPELFDAATGFRCVAAPKANAE